MASEVVAGPAPLALRTRLQTVTASEAARLLQRRKAWVLAELRRGAAGAFPGAYRDPPYVGEWRIPARDVEAYQVSMSRQHGAGNR